MTTPDALEARAGACALCDVVKPDARALRDHVMNVHPDEFCGIYHDQPCQHDRRERYLAALLDADPYALVQRRDDRLRFADAVMTVADAEAAAMAAEIHRLRAQNEELTTRLAAEERQHESTIDDREHFHDMADRLAYAVAPEQVIGEHSSMNCPWENALELVTPMAEVDELREELERQTALAEQGARANQELKKMRARVAELERPAIERQRNEVRGSFTALSAQAAQDGDHEGAFDIECRLREREEQWAREDAAVPADAHRP